MQDIKLVGIIHMKDGQKYVIPAEKVEAVNNAINEKSQIFISELMRTVSSYNVDYISVRRASKKDLILLNDQKRDLLMLKKIADNNSDQVFISGFNK